MDLFNLVKELTELAGPTGQEDDVNHWLRDRWTSQVDSFHETRVGNIAAHIGGSGPKLLIQAHSDEIGFVVRSIDESGFLHLSTAQRIDNPAKRYPVGQDALILGRNGHVPGLFAAPSGHVLTDRQREQQGMSYEDFFVDVGVSSKQEAINLGIHPGARVIWNPETRQMGSRIIGKAMDDRMLLALMTALLEEIDREQLTCDLWFGVTVQEENGLIGANSLYQEIDADRAIALEVGLTGDIPKVQQATMPTRLGAGPILVHKDSSAHYSHRVIWDLDGVAEANQIPIQHAIFDRFGSDGAEFIRHGIPTALMAVPTRYTHSPFEMIDSYDLEQSLKLLKAFITTAPE